MLESGWLFTGAIAVLMTVLALLTQTSAVRHFGQADGISIVVGALGTIAWGIFAYGSLEVVAVATMPARRATRLSKRGLAELSFSVARGANTVH